MMKSDWKCFEKILFANNIKSFYHFTDIANLASIKKHGGLFSWHDCALKNIHIPKPGGSYQSQLNDNHNGKRDFVRLAFNMQHPMLFVAKRDGRINDPIWLHIDIEVAYLQETEFSDKNAAAFNKYTPIIGATASHLQNVRFDILKKAEEVHHYNLSENEKMYNQAEVLVKSWIPLEYIRNI